MTDGFREFEFDLPGALLDRLTLTFEAMESAPLLWSNMNGLPDEQGVYQLLHKNQIVYIGKTDGEAGLRKRLSRHAFTIQHRHNLDPSEVSFKALRVFVFTAIDLETQLIRHYGGQSRVTWQKSGFGSNDPGRQRDETKLKPGGFDALYPIDLDYPLRLDRLQSPLSAAALLNRLNTEVPYTIRAESDGNNPHPDLSVELIPPGESTTAREVVMCIVAGLPPGWQATLLPGRIIFYREHRDYSAGSVIARSE